MEKLQIGLVGIGYLGSIHLELLRTLDEFELVGVYDRNLSRQALIKEKYPDLKVFEGYQELLNEVQAVGIIASTPAHFELAKLAIENQKAVFVEKPICATNQEALALAELLSTRNSHFQVGHVERFNPVYQAFKSLTNNRKIDHFKSERRGTFQQRGSEVSVILDLMIHDIDLLLAQNESEIVHLSVEAKQKYSAFADEVLAEIAFSNGQKATLFASRIATDRKRSLTLHTELGFYNLDMLNQQLTFLTNEGTAIPYVVPSQNALEQQWLDFCNCFKKNKLPIVGQNAGISALKLALQIEDMAQKKLIQIHH